jgi:hypothetical protein
MNIVKKEWVYSHYEMSWAKQELAEYEFDGRIDFARGPIFLYDEKNHIVVDYEDTGRKDAIKVLINDVIVDYKNGYDETGPFCLFKSVKVDRFRLSKNYGLQDFFNDHKKAKCIVFFVYTSSIFHDGYTIRVYIDEEGYTPKQIEN